MGASCHGHGHVHTTLYLCIVSEYKVPTVVNVLSLVSVAHFMRISSHLVCKYTMGTVWELRSSSQSSAFVCLFLVQRERELKNLLLMRNTREVACS